MPSAKIETRDMLAQVYSETLATEFTEGISAYTLENMIQEELDRLEGPVVGKYRHALIPYIEGLQTQFEANIEKIKAIPPEEYELNTEGEYIVEEETTTGTTDTTATA